MTIHEWYLGLCHWVYHIQNHQKKSEVLWNMQVSGAALRETLVELCKAAAAVQGFLMPEVVCLLLGSLLSDSSSI
jgi:hypothetical protein